MSHLAEKEKTASKGEFFWWDMYNPGRPSWPLNKCVFFSEKKKYYFFSRDV